MKTQTSTPGTLPESPLPPGMELALAASFGSVRHWRANFVSALRAHGGETGVTGKGGLLLLLRDHDATLAIRWVPDVEATQADGQVLLSVKLDSTGNRDWDALVESIAWNDVLSRYQDGIKRNSQALAATHAQAGQATLLDVRREGVFKAATTRIAGAQWHNPAAVAQWATNLPTDREVVVYCVYGHEVSRAIAIRLRAAGINARYLQGGIDGWQAAGLGVEMIAGPQTTAASPSAS